MKIPKIYILKGMLYLGSVKSLSSLDEEDFSLHMETFVKDKMMVTSSVKFRSKIEQLFFYQSY